MSRIGKKPIPLPATVKYKVQGNTVLVEGPKGKLTAMVPAGIKLETKDGQLIAVREKEELAALHGLTRALLAPNRISSAHRHRGRHRSQADPPHDQRY
jgi:large subunit ribosomal protein L6